MIRLVRVNIVFEDINLKPKYFRLRVTEPSSPTRWIGQQNTANRIIYEDARFFCTL